MKAMLLTTVFAVALHGQAVADDVSSEAVEAAANNLSHEMTNCAVFNTVMGACMLRSNEKELAEQSSKGARVYLDYAAWFGKKGAFPNSTKSSCPVPRGRAGTCSN